MRESFRLSMDGVPAGIDPEEIRSHPEADENVKEVHHLRIRPLSTTENTLTAHVVLHDMARLEETKRALHRELIEHNITHSTLVVCQRQICSKIAYQPVPELSPK